MPGSVHVCFAFLFWSSNHLEHFLSTHCVFKIRVAKCAPIYDRGPRRYVNQQLKYIHSPPRSVHAPDSKVLPLAFNVCPVASKACPLAPKNALSFKAFRWPRAPVRQPPEFVCWPWRFVRWFGFLQGQLLASNICSLASGAVRWPLRLIRPASEFSPLVFYVCLRASIVCLLFSLVCLLALKICLPVSKSSADPELHIQGVLPGPKVCLMTSKVCLMTFKVCLLTFKVCLLASKVCLMTSKVCLLTSKVCLMTSKICLMTSKACLLSPSICRLPDNVCRFLQ